MPFTDLLIEPAYASKINAGFKYLPKIAFKENDSNLTSNSTALQNDPDLLLSVTAGEKYILEAINRYGSGTTADIKFAFNFPSGTLHYDALGLDTALALTTVSSLAEASDTTRAWGGAGLTSYRYVKFWGVYVCTASGTFRTRAAQNSAVAETPVIKAGSYLILHKI